MPFDWPAWMATPEAKRLTSVPEAVATASADELGKLLAALVRSDRLNEGSLAAANDGGMLIAIARRAKLLAAGQG